MGRRKISIEPIAGDRNRSATYLKRKTGLFKKAYELAVLTDSDVAVLVFGRNGKLAEFCSGDIDQFLVRYTEYSGAVEKRGPEHFAQASADPRAATQNQDKNNIDGLSDDQLGSRHGTADSVHTRSSNDGMQFRTRNVSWTSQAERPYSEQGISGAGHAGAHDRRWSAPLGVDVHDLFQRHSHEPPMPVTTPSLSIKVPPPPSPGSAALQHTPGSLSAQSVSPLPLSAPSPFVPLSPMDVGTQPHSADDLSMEGPLGYQQSSSNMLASPVALPVSGDAYNNALVYESQSRYHQPASPIPVYEHAFGMNASTVPQNTMAERLMPPPDLSASGQHTSPLPSPKSPLPGQVSSVPSPNSASPAHSVIIPGVDTHVPVSPRAYVPMAHQYP